MKTDFLKLTYFLYLCSTPLGWAEQAVFQTANEFHGARYWSSVLETDLVGQPEWETLREVPPLSPRRAESAARDRLLETFPAIKDWESEKICLRRAGNPRNWIYIVEMKPPAQGLITGGRLESIEIVVLMNGKTIKPKKIESKPNV